VNLREAESLGFRLELEQNRLAVYGPEGLMTEDSLARLKLHREGLIRQVAVRKFCQLVRAFGTAHGVLLDDHVIEDQLGEGDIDELLRVDVAAKQGWAEMLCYRLSRERKRPD
jgi:hypothetical protein